MKYQQICKNVLSFDRTVLFAGIVTFEARIVAAEYREGSVPVLTTRESELSVMHSLLRMATRKTLEHKLGKAIYSFTQYQKVKRATIVIFEGNKYEAILMVSFDNEADHERLIIRKILPFLKEIGRGFEEKDFSTTLADRSYNE